MVTDDLEQDVRGAQLFRDEDGAAAHGEVPARGARALVDRPDAVLSSIANVPDWIDRSP